MKHQRAVYLSVSLAFGLGAVGMSLASTPAASAVTASRQVGHTSATTWSGVLPGGANAGGACDGSTPQLEDHHQVKVVIPKGLYAKRTVRLEVATSFDAPPAADTIITVSRGDKTLGSSDNYSVASGEHLFLFDPDPGTYDVAVCTFVGAPTPYHAALTLTTLQRSLGTAPLAHGVRPTYRTYTAPVSVRQGGEPSVGADWRTSSGQSPPLMYQSSVWTYRVTIVGTHATWTDVSAPNNQVSLDPILFTDRYTGRTIASQLTGVDSLAAYTDDNGATWIPSQGGGIPSGVDHQSIGGGHYPASLNLATAAYPDAMYYCSQDLATAFCARSDDGGLTFGAGVPIYGTNCAGLHGHVKVAPDGTVYVPNKACDGKQGVVVSTDAGTTWTMRTIPGSSNGNGDPSVATDDKNTVYYAYVDADGHAKVATSRDQGAHWAKPVDVGARMHVVNAVFPEAVGGSAGRVAVAFLGTTTAGNAQDEFFGQNKAHTRYVGAEWHLYVATSYDGGKHWQTVDATPHNPVQRGQICLAGISCSSGRNLLDFNDMTIDRTGRVVVAYADGCEDRCIRHQSVGDNTHSAIASITRQSSGRPLRTAR